MLAQCATAPVSPLRPAMVQQTVQFVLLVVRSALGLQFCIDVCNVIMWEQYSSSALGGYGIMTPFCVTMKWCVPPAQLTLALRRMCRPGCMSARLPPTSSVDIAYLHYWRRLPYGLRCYMPATRWHCSSPINHALTCRNMWPAAACALQKLTERRVLGAQEHTPCDGGMLYIVPGGTQQSMCAATASLPACTITGGLGHSRCKSVHTKLHATRMFVHMRVAPPRR